MPKFKFKKNLPLEAVSPHNSRLREIYERKIAISNLAQVSADLAKQDNVLVLVPAQGVSLSYQITCSRATAMRKL